MTVCLIHGDCLDQLQFTDYIDLYISDIPYGITNCRWDTPVDLDKLWQLLDPSKTPVILFAQTPFDKILGASNIKHLRYEWIWQKTHATGHLNSKKMPMKAHENILVFGKTPTYNPQMTHNHIRKIATKRFDGGNKLQSEIYGKEVKDYSYDSTSRYPRDIQTFSTDKQKSNLHPTQKPVALMEYLIKTYTNEGDMVVDFCMGSGTTGIACLNTGRNFIGIEKDKDIFNIAQHRILSHNRLNSPYIVAV